MAFSKSKESRQKSWDALWKTQCSQILLNFRSSWDENLFLTNTGKITTIKWSTAFHILKRSIFQLTFYMYSCPLISEKETAFWRLTQDRVPKLCSSNSSRSQLRAGSAQNRELFIAVMASTETSPWARRGAAFWHNVDNRNYKLLVEIEI